MSKVRLIDADALTEFLEGEYDNDCCHDDDWSAGRASAFITAENHIDEMSTIDAIPVEWLEALRQKMEKTVYSDSVVGAIDIVLWEWEQEAKTV